MKTPLTGGCLCGSVRYECSAEPAITALCHCNACQKMSGGAFLPTMAVPKAAVKMTGEVRFFERKADSGATSSLGFCPTCGANVAGKTTSMPDMVVLVAASLDDPSVYKPAMHVFSKHAQLWDRIADDIPRFPGLPEMQGD